jgi:hypothetical protein
VKIAAQLQHPHILPLLDSGEAAGFLYFVMPYVKGQSLRERLARDGELPSISRATCVMRVESSHSDTERLQPTDQLRHARHPAEPRDRGESAARREVAGSLSVQPSGYGVIVNVTLIFCGLFDATGEVTGIVAVYVPTASMVFVGCMMRLYGAVDVRPLF